MVSEYKDRLLTLNKTVLYKPNSHNYFNLHASADTGNTWNIFGTTKLHTYIDED